MIVVGIDPSVSHTAIVAMQGEHGDQVIPGAIVTKIIDHRNKYDRIAYMRSALKAILARMTITPEDSLIVVEGYAFGANGMRETLAEWGGVLRVMLWEERFPFMIVSPSMLKKFVTGKGNAEKNLVMKAVYKKWGYDAGNDNEADAYGLAKLGVAYLGKDHTKEQADMFRKLEVIRRGMPTAGMAVGPW